MNEPDITSGSTRKRVRFSLLTILLVMTLVACGITIWQLWREVGPLRAEVRRLRDEVGELVVEDPAKIYAIEVRQPDELTWRWRLWIPAGRTFIIRSVGEDIPKAGFPQAGGSMWIRDAGEMWLEYRITKDPRTGTWRGKLSHAGGAVGSDEHAWVEWSRRNSSGEGVGNRTTAFDPDKNVLITRLRFGQVRSSVDIPDPAPGFMIWLEPQ